MSVTFDDDTLAPNGGLVGAALLAQRLGDDHPDTLTSMNKLALTLHALDDVEQAVRLEHEAAEAATGMTESGR